MEGSPIAPTVPSRWTTDSALRRYGTWSSAARTRLPDDPARWRRSRIPNAGQRVDDPEAPGCPSSADELRYGWDLQPEERFLYVARRAPRGPSALAVDLPKRDNLDLFWLQIVVHPDHRRQGHGTRIMTEALRMAEQSGRHIWVGSAEDDLGARKFAERFGFRYASHDARRRQRLADVDTRPSRGCSPRRRRRPPTTVERLVPPVPDDMLSRWSRSPPRSTTRRWAP